MNSTPKPTIKELEQFLEKCGWTEEHDFVDGTVLGYLNSYVNGFFEDNIQGLITLHDLFYGTARTPEEISMFNAYLDGVEGLLILQAVKYDTEDILEAMMRALRQSKPIKYSEVNNVHYFNY